jgi:hypothetical protein
MIFDISFLFISCLFVTGLAWILADLILTGVDALRYPALRARKP